jgi:hypothetical protein
VIFTADPHPYIVATGTIASIGGAISTLEWIANRRQLADDGLYSWAVAGCRAATVGRGLVKRTVNWLLSYGPFLAILVLRLVALLILPSALWLNRWPVIVLGAVVVTTLLLNLRSPYGMDGSDQMSLQIFAALFLGYLSGTRLGLQVSLCFIGAQACLSYFTSGMAKALSPQWRTGGVVFAIFNTRTYGYEPAARFLYSHPSIAKAATYGAVTMECAFPLVLVVGWPFLVVFVAWGVAFHLMNATVMGLNSFFWSFSATYPAVIYLSVLIGQGLHSSL